MLGKGWRTKTCLAGLLAVSVAGPTWGQMPQLEIGALTCTVLDGQQPSPQGSGPPQGGGPSGGARNITCSYKPFTNGPEESYLGTLQIVGSDDEYFAGRSMMWVVRSSSIKHVAPGILQQTYSADALTNTGAAALVGEENRSLRLHQMNANESQAGSREQLTSIVTAMSLKLDLTPA